MMEQLSLFAESLPSSKQFKFSGNYCNADWSCKTKTKNGIKNIVDRIDFNLTKVELKTICRKAVKIEVRNYGYSVFFEDDGKKKLFVRFDNFTTSRRRTVFEHIDLYFEQAEF